MLPRISKRSSPTLPSTRSNADRDEVWESLQGVDVGMADSKRSSKNPKAGKPAAAKSRSPAAHVPEHGEAGDDIDLRMRIARRAYEISQGEGAGDDADNWLRAERELRDL